MGSIEILKDMTNKKYNVITKRGNDSIKRALMKAKDLGFNDVYIADQGGWITYRQFPPKFKMNLYEIKSDLGIIDTESLINIKDSILLLNSSPGYFCFQPLKDIYTQCKNNNNFLIVDITATIGLLRKGNQSNQPEIFGDILIASFGKQKPVDYGNLGFLSSDIPFENKDTIHDLDYDEVILTKKLNNVHKRRSKMMDIAIQIKKDLSNHKILHQGHQAINVIVGFDTELEKNQIIQYCIKKGYEYVICPKYYKVNIDAISIEVKKIFL